MNFDKKKGKKIIKKYNSSAPFYESRYKSIQFNKYLQIFSNFELEGKNIIDVGCGTGLIFDFLNKNYNSIRTTYFSLVGVDMSNKMLDIFKEKLSQFSILNHKVNLIRADLEYLPFRSERFNTLFSFTSYQNLSNIEKGFSESLRVLKNKAETYISVLKKSINQQDFINLIKPRLINMKIIDNQKIEDLIIEGILNK